MNLDGLKALSYPELQRVYSAYLDTQGLSKNTITTSRNDAFYLLKNDSSIDFWELLSSNDFEELAKLHLRKTLERRSSGDVEANLSGYMSHIRRFRRFALGEEAIPKVSTGTEPKPRRKLNVNVPQPCGAEVEHYLNLWNQLENYRLQEDALNRLFFDYAPNNTDMADILLKAATLNEFYSTNIFSIYPVAKHILELNIDQRLRAGDVTLVDDIKQVEISGKVKQFYSFATKYCSHHNPIDYPIYDSYVDDVLLYFRDKDHFASFNSSDLKNYAQFKKILIAFGDFYSLGDYSLKQLDQYLWQLGKTYFPKQYK